MIVGVAELKARLSEYLGRVRAGEEVIVSDRGRPFAKVVPLRQWEQGDEGDRLQRLAREGVIRMPAQSERTAQDVVLPATSKRAPPRGVLNLLLEDRAGGR